MHFLMGTANAQDMQLACWQTSITIMMPRECCVLRLAHLSMTLSRDPTGAIDTMLQA